VNILYLFIILSILVFHIPNVFNVVNASSDFVCIRLVYLLFPTVIEIDDALNHLDGDRLGTSIHHRPLDQSVTRFERSLGSLRLGTFYDRNCRAGRGDFNAVKIMEKDAGLTAQMRSRILTVLEARSLSCHHLSPPGSISAR